MDLVQQIKEAFFNLTGAKLRSFLAILGILVGTGSVVALVSSGQLATEHALEQFKKLGTDLLSINMYQSGGSSESSGTVLELNLNDINDIKNAIPSIKEIAPYTLAFQSLAFAGNKLKGSIIGTTQSLQDVIKIDMARGRFISPLDQNNFYCVIGDKLFQQIKKLGGFNPIGKQLQIGKNFFTIVGVADQWAENSFFNQDVNSSVIISIPASKIIYKNTQINNIVLLLNPEADFKQIESTIKRIVQQRIPGENLFFRSPQQIINSMTSQRKTLTLLLGLIGGISLFVGGIGVMNIMLVSVVERRKEIGIRMAVGARQRDIQTLFLIESITLALFGGLLGVITGIIISFMIAYLANWTFTFYALPPVVGFFVSFAVGIFFGFYPAYQASQLDPIETLRSD